jgi:hypothetical protein
MFVLRAKCKLSDASADWPLWGLAGTGAVPWADTAPPGRQQPWPTPTAWPCRLPGWARWRCRAGCGPAPQPPAAADLPAGSWAALEALSGTPRVMAATSEQFVPQMVNLDLVDGVNFKKGCYPGPGGRGAQPVPRHAQAARRHRAGHGHHAPGPGNRALGRPRPTRGPGGAGRRRPRAGARWPLPSSSWRRWKAAACTSAAPKGPLRVSELPYAVPTEPA